MTNVEFDPPELTDEAIEQLFNAMPNGVDGFLKHWGYRQFAHAVEAEVRKQLLPMYEGLETSREARLLLALLDMRIADSEKEFKRAVASERWSQVSGYHGIGTGLLIARRLIVEESA